MARAPRWVARNNYSLYTSIPMFGVHQTGPVAGSIRDVPYIWLLITTKDPKDSEATSRLINELKSAFGYASILTYTDKEVSIVKN